MQTLFIAAGVTALLTGIVHSVLGEVLIFRHVRSGGLVPAMGARPLRERNIRILWTTWHLASVFGWAFAIILIGKKGRHPGWIALLLVAALTWAA